MHKRKNRIKREKKTVSLMIAIYCRHIHRNKNICDDCSHLHDYAMKRLDTCKYGIDKPTCNKCPVHCYRKIEREQIRRVMRFAGPKMLFSHPILALFHLYYEKFEKSPLL